MTNFFNENDTKHFCLSRHSPEMQILGGANYIRTKNCSHSDIIFDRTQVIKIDLTVLRLILCIGEDRITSHHMCKVGGRF